MPVSLPLRVKNKRKIENCNFMPGNYPLIVCLGDFLNTDYLFMGRKLGTFSSNGHQLKTLMDESYLFLLEKPSKIKYYITQKLCIEIFISSY